MAVKERRRKKNKYKETEKEKIRMCKMHRLLASVYTMIRISLEQSRNFKSVGYTGAV